ncbi:short transient receptor potential channel 5-like [Sipha flava]|uniref:Short transient receptor potential channel 5-like n=1 Tax=Sipha flava TaxID=143950 RepID=A0A8B8FPU1_9HEMI|nr:short transient receptor potential channel 5-like [Sipha flava]
MILTLENNLDKSGSMKDPLDLILKIAIVVYVFSFIIRTVKLALVQGPKRYFSMLWNIYDCLQLSIMATTITCWWITYLNLQAKDDGLAMERKYWQPLDMRLVAEGLLAVATVMSYLRLLFLCQLSYALGPMQVSLGKMTTDFARFAILFGIIVLAFTAGLCRFYQYYSGMTKIDPVTGYEITQEDSFIDIFSTLKTLFWGIFCMTSSTAGSVVIETSMSDDMNEEFVASNHYFTQAIGTLLFSLFEIISVIVMLNMLIATMTNTFQRVTGNSYIEWVFGRTQVFLSFSMHTELPLPLNFIPTLHCGIDMFGCLRNCCKAGATGVANLISSKEYQTKSNSEDESYRVLMTKLIRRYFRDKLSSGYVQKCNPICC